MLEVVDFPMDCSCLEAYMPRSLHDRILGDFVCERS